MNLIPTASTSLEARKISRVLIANRGEIAVRIIRTLRRLGMTAVAVYSEADRDALHVQLADLALPIGPAPAPQSYLRAEVLIAAALQAGADAVHPGYGFVSENAEFARACGEAGLIFIGPSAEAIAAMGDKIAARDRVAAAGVPVVPGVGAPGMSDAALISAARDIGFPLLIKPSAGGGGKGMRAVHSAADLPAALDAARREAKGSFGDDTLLLERLITRPRHLEVQVLFDGYGNGVHLGERECSLQRRHQKIVEEAPSVLLDAATRERLGRLALEVGRACGYTNAGTVEFICSADHPTEVFFMEMNTRLQVEHPVTEEVWGIDLVAEQIRIAAGAPLGYVQEDLKPQGHAVEARIYAEDPTEGFLPSPGTLLACGFAEGHPGIRVDTGVRPGSEISAHYDPMIAKIIASGADRAEALQRLHTALMASAVVGVASNIGYLHHLVADPAVRAGDIDTELVEARLADHLPPLSPPMHLTLIAAVAMHVWPRVAESLGNSPAPPWGDRSGWRLGARAETWWRLGVPRRAGIAGGESDARVVGVSARAASRVGAGFADQTIREYAVRCEDDVPVTISLTWERVDHQQGAAEILAQVDGASHRVRVDRPAQQDPPAIWVTAHGSSWSYDMVGLNDRAVVGSAAASGQVVAPMPGTLVRLMVMEGEEVSVGQPVAAVEAMKMEHVLRAGVDGRVDQIFLTEGARVARGEVLVVIAAEELPLVGDLTERREQANGS